MAKNNDSGEKKRQGIFRRLIARPFLVLGWIAAGIAFILLAVFVFDLHRNAPMSLLSGLKTGPKVFHTKIPEEIKIAQNLFREKIQAVEQPVKPPTKMESMPPVEKKAVSSQPMVAPLEISEPQQETESVQPVETQTKIETTPPMAKAVPSQPTDAQLEISELQQETEQSVYSQPAVAPSEQRELPEKADLRQAEVYPQPVKEDVIGKTEERIIHREKWLLSQESFYYTIQLMGARKEALLFDFVEKNQLLEQNEIAFYQTTFEDKPWFQLLYGVYATKKDAQAAAERLPPKIRKSSPWVRRLSAVQKAIRGKTSPF